ncbi:MAG: hypothetical protein WD766_10440 [Gemmatimonadota bacterium]
MHDASGAAAVIETGEVTDLVNALGEEAGQETVGVVTLSEAPAGDDCPPPAEGCFAEDEGTTWGVQLPGGKGEEPAFG